MAAKKKATRKKATAKTGASKALAVDVMVEPQIELKLEMGTADIVAIGVAKYEDDLRTEINAARHELNASKKKLDAASKKLDIEVHKQGEKDTAADLKAYAVAAAKVGLMPLQVASSYLHEDKAGNVQVRVTYERQQVGNNRNGTPTGAEAKILSASKVVRYAQQDAQDFREDVEEHQNRVLELQGYLSDLPAYERKVKAHVAARALKSSKNGAAILDAIGGAPEQVKLLPANKA